MVRFFTSPRSRSLVLLALCALLPAGCLPSDFTNLSQGKDAKADAGGHDAASSPPSEHVTGPWLSGVGTDVGKGSLDDFAAWRGRPVEIVGTWNDDDKGNQAELWSIAPGGDYAEFAGPIDIAIGGIYKGDGDTWAQAAAGAYDERWRRVLTKLASYRSGKGTTYIRFAHQFNGGAWIAKLWQVTPSEVNDFKTAWGRMYALKKAVFPQAKLVFCPNDGTESGIDVRTAFPGKQVVDLMGIVTYNQYPFVSTEAQARVKWTDIYEDGAPLGPESWRKFAEQHGVALAITEWASNPDPSDSVAGGGDSPVYMQQMHDWVAAHAGSGPGQIEYEILFNMDKFALWPSAAQVPQPQAAAKYRELW